MCKKTDPYSEFRPGPREKEDTPEFQKIAETYGYWEPVASRAYARVLKHPTFPGGCPVHGEVICSTATGACLKCMGHLRHAARLTGRRTYRHHCYACRKETVHRTRDEECLECLPVRGPGSERSQARREGRTSFLATCWIHGEVPHHTTGGWCLTCKTSGGAPRRSRVVSGRVDARKVGATTYLHQCRVHGEVAHGVQHGKCLTCFTAMGVPRALKTARAQARRAGDKVFYDYCDTCGDDTRHLVSHGKCATCHTSSGLTRANRAVKSG